ncbi:MAG: prolipoprotein diacylglyceryl transferase [Chloroflexota bacterium]|nr:prolipoprotein diacylglyceryl transferase [Chloroflexota bacterium]|tara:strand:- start:167 stop:1033 length:867 start_codon:yes stop_codon:yes gene_type:complete
MASISIGINPNLIDMGSIILSWHGVMTFIAVAVAVWLVARWGGKDGMVVDSIYSVSVWAIIGGVVGARILHVIDFWDEVYKNDFISVFAVWSGGIAIYGAILGGFAGGALYIVIRNSDLFLSIWRTALPFMGEAHRANLPNIGRLADITAPALLIAQAIGRIGDLINGEHFASVTDLPWGVIYTHPSSPGVFRPPTHPAVGYELLFDLVLLAAIWPLRDRLRPHGMFFTLYLATYSIGRFFISFMREEFNEYFGALNEAQVVAIIVVIITVPLLVWKAQLVRPTSNTS